MIGQFSSTPPDGLAGLYFLDLAGKKRIAMQVISEDQRAEIKITDKAGKAKFTAP
jgi:hypothetical protein